jgi:hypothetical protein
MTVPRCHPSPNVGGTYLIKKINISRERIVEHINVVWMDKLYFSYRDHAKAAGTILSELLGEVTSYYDHPGRRPPTSPKAEINNILYVMYL